MRYWWVNHKQTVRQEVGGCYLWSPVREANGARSQFYDNMRAASPGDVVLSYADGQIGYVGRVTDFAVPAPKPDSFGDTGAYWSADGWLLPVVWQPVPVPVRPKHFLDALRPLLPAKYSPINSANGNGNQKAYLAEISQQVFELLFPDYSQHDGDDALVTYPAVTFIEDAVEKIITNDLQLSETVRQQVIEARTGQGLFKANVIKYGGRVCRVTGVENPMLLIASHIKPWRVCKTAAERLDGANGLLLAPHVDRIFDRGLISFEKNGQFIVSSFLNQIDLIRMGLINFIEQGIGQFTDEQDNYLEYHRNHVLI